MRLTIIMTFLFFQNISYSQSDSLTEVILNFQGTSKKHLEYQINNDSIKDGSYKEFSTDGILIIEGYYNDGVKSGIWNFYDNSSRNRLIIRYDYDINKELIYNYLYPSQRMTMVEIDGKNKMVEAEEVCHFPGGNTILQEYLSGKIQDLKLSDSQFSGKVYIQFDIDTLGNVINVKSLYNSLDKQLEQNLIGILENMPKWIPTVYKGIKWKTTYTLPINLKK